MTRRSAGFLAWLLLIPTRRTTADEPIPPASVRFAAASPAEVPDFQRHVLPLMGRLGCNGRACHGSFQGAGGLRLSLFGYDFDADHKALLADDTGRFDAEAPELSLILQKPTLAIPHKGGKRLEADSWAYQVLARWIESGAPPADGRSHFARLEVIPAEIRLAADSPAVPLRVVAHWADGSAEDVTCLTRFRTNDEAIAEVSPEGLVSPRGAGDTHIVAFYDNGVAAVPVLRPVSDRVGPDAPERPTPTEIDRLVLAKLRKLGIVPSELCTDAEFLRRATLDLTGSLPTPEEARAFAADSRPGKRANKIDELLGRPAYAAYWTNRLCEVMGDSPRAFPNSIGGDRMARRWYEWIQRRVAENAPYDELIAGIVLATSRRPDQSYADYLAEESSYDRDDAPADYATRPTMPYYWARRTVRTADDRALNFSYAFLGVRLECAQCHKHPFDQWTQNDFKDFTAFFGRVAYGNAPGTKEAIQELEKTLELGDRKGNDRQRELTRLVKQGKVVPWPEVFIAPPGRRPRPAKGEAKPPRGPTGPTPRVLGGDAIDLAGDADPRGPLMEWMRRPDNPYFARAFVNRVWASHFGHGLIDPTDDLNLANPPSNAELLDALAGSFVRSGFDMKALHREILRSDAYQRSWRPNDTNRQDERNFSRAAIRRLPAEVVIDAVAQATAADAALPAFATVMESRSFGPIQGAGAKRRANDYAGRVFGRSARDTNCDCSRSDEPNLLQAVFLQNDGEVLSALDQKDGWIAEQEKRLREAPAHTTEDLSARVAVIEKRLDRARKAGSKGDAVHKRLEERLAALRKPAESRAASPDSGAPLDLSADDRRDLIERAYLRTLGRTPDASELAASLAYFETASDPVAGLRGILWALLNTKEFITNH